MRQFRRLSFCIRILGLITLVWAQSALAAFDQDGDGITDASDNCTRHANPQQVDSNGDGFGNLCDADLNNDGIVDSLDYETLIQFYADANLDADLNGDGQITEWDAQILLSRLGRPPGPAGVASLPLYDRPRIMASDQLFTYLQTRLQTYPYSKFWAFIEPMAQYEATTIPPCPVANPNCGAPDSISDYNDSTIRILGEKLPFMAMAYRLTGDPVYLASVRTWMNALVSYQDWASNEDIGAAHLLMGMSIAYDWLYDSFTPAERQSYRDKMVYHTNILHDLLITPGSTWWRDHLYSNHNYTNVTAIAMTAVALYGEAPDSDAWLDAAADNYNAVLALLSPDGASKEGASYWALQMTHMMSYFISIYRFDNATAAQIFDSDYFNNTVMYRLYASMPGYAQIVDYSDSPRHDVHRSTHVLRGLAAIFSDPYAQWLAERIDAAKEDIGESSLSYWLNMLWYSPGVAQTPPDDLPLYRYFDNFGILISRSSWQDDAFWSFHKSGAYQGYHAEAAGFFPGSHAHPDSGQFLTWSQGRWLVIDDGLVKLKRTENHNVLTFNDAVQLGSDQTWFNSIEVLQNGGTVTQVYQSLSDEYQYIVTELASMYRAAADVSSWQRSFITLPEGYQVIRDDVSLGSAGQIDALLHAEYAAKLVNGNEMLLNPRDTVPEAIDRSGNNNDGVTVNGFAMPGVSGNSLYFIGTVARQLSGATDRIAFPTLANAAFPASGSLSLWLKSDDNPGQGSKRLLDNSSGQRNNIYMVADTGTPAAPVSQIEVTFASRDVADNFRGVVDLTPDAWHHLVVTWDTANELGQLFVDGQLVYSAPIEDSEWVPDAQQFILGYGFIGYLDEVRLYDRILDASEVGTLFNLDEVSAGLTGSWTFDGIDAQVAPDFREYAYRLLHPSNSTVESSVYLIPLEYRSGPQGNYLGRQLSHGLDSPGDETIVHFVGDSTTPATYDSASNRVSISHGDYSIEIDFANRSVTRVPVP